MKMSKCLYGYVVSACPVCAIHSHLWCFDLMQIPIEYSCLIVGYFSYIYSFASTFHATRHFMVLGRSSDLVAYELILLFIY